ncbi:MAG: tetratricopeptide repeat protein, partial [Herbaspirillum sp.]
LGLATLAVRKKDYDTALRIATQIQKQGDKKVAGFLLEGDVLTAQQKPDLALAAYKQAFALDKNSMTAIKLYEAMARAGKAKDGQEHLVQWLNQNPQDLSIRSYLGVVYLGDRQAKLAIEQFEAVVRVQPKNPVALNNLALAYQLQNDPRATEFAERAYAVAPNNGAILDTLGWLLVERGDAKRGLTLLEKATQLMPDQAEVRFHYAKALLKAGDKAKALKELEIVASNKQYPKAGEAQALLQQSR